jgi:hypothetical protein
VIRIRFPNAESKRAALGRLAGRLNFKSWYLAAEGVVFTVEGPATNEQNGPALTT